MVSQFKNLQNLEFLREVRLEPIVTNYNSRFSLTTLRGQFILLTGGIGPGNQSSKQVLLYDKESRKMKKLPKLNTARDSHTSCRSGSKTSVFDHWYLKSL